MHPGDASNRTIRLDSRAESVRFRCGLLLSKPIFPGLAIGLERPGIRSPIVRRAAADTYSSQSSSIKFVLEWELSAWTICLQDECKRICGEEQIESFYWCDRRFYWVLVSLPIERLVVQRDGCAPARTGCGLPA